MLAVLHKELTPTLKKYISYFLHFFFFFVWAVVLVVQCYPRIAEQRTVMVVVSFVAAEDQLDSDRQPGGSWAFTSQLPVWLSHIVPFRAQTVYSPCSGHHCKSELIWKALRIFFFFFGASKSRQFAFVSLLEDFTGQLRQADIEHAKESFPLRCHLHHPFVSDSIFLNLKFNVTGQSICFLSEIL